jgi:ADP-ribose pyrophosphatase YjhB (NUDIX family)
VIPVWLGRLGYRAAYVGLRVVSLVVRPHTRGVKCMVVAGGDVLLVRHSYGRRQWDMPGGFVRRKEAFEAAARRELGEELGIAEEGRLTDLGEVRRDHLGRHETIRLYRIDLAARAGAIQGFELQEIGWFAPGELPEPRAELVDDVLAIDRRFAR